MCETFGQEINKIFGFCFPVKGRNHIQKQGRKNLKLFLEFRALLLHENYSAYWSRSVVDHLVVTLLPVELTPTACGDMDLFPV